MLRLDSRQNVLVGGTDISSPRGYAMAAGEFDPTGNLIWSFNYRPDAASDTCTQQIETDDAGGVYVAGGGNDSYILTKAFPDPAWTRVFPLGTNRSGAPFAIASDANRNVYVAGYVYGDSKDFLLLKYDSQGKLLWTRQSDGGGFSEDICTQLLADAAENVYVIGSSKASRVSSHYTVVKYGKAGQTLWQQDYADPALPLSVYGAYISAVFFDLVGNICVCGADGIIKYDRDGKLVWRERHSAWKSIPARDGGIIANVVSDGWSPGDTSWIHRYDRDGRLLWRSGVHTNELNGGFIGLDEVGNAYLGSGGSPVSRVSKYDSEGTRIWTSTLPSQIQFVRGMQIGPTGSVFICSGGGTAKFVRISSSGTPKLLQLSADQDVDIGGSVTLSAQVTGSAPLLYQWILNDAPIAGATAPTLHIDTVTSQDLGSYTLRAQNSAGAIYSKAIELRATRPNITVRPFSSRILAGQSTVLRAVATGTPPLHFTWLRNGKPFARGWTNELAVQVLESSDFSVTVTNNQGKSSGVIAKFYCFPDRPLQDWTRRGAGAVWTLNSVVNTGGLFVAVGGVVESGTRTYGAILTSTDGVQWVTQLAGVPNYFNSVAYGNGVFVAASGQPSGSSAISNEPLTSSDGAHWAASPSSPPHLVIVGFHKGQFIGVGRDRAIMASSNGRDWRAIQGPGIADQMAFVSGGQRCMFSGKGFFGEGVVMSSQTGESWDLARFSGAPLGSIEGMAYGEGRFLILSARNADLVDVFSSQDGLAFTWVTSLTSHHSSLAYGNGTFVAVGDGFIDSSRDGRKWETLYAQPASSLRSVTFGAGTFVAVGMGIIFQSGDVEKAYVTAARATPNSINPSLTIEGKVGAEFLVEFGNNLINWWNAGAVRLTAPSLQLEVTNAAVGQGVFYRVTGH
ncbi:MAG: hypothetical protein HYR88_13660 [Verrucomicrobia bacterium]|nr:hypothetical protein [Verrucomicrobiota bacterium]MBI3869610.1 hypothetical protein [Verrucomicrobiota bacterium]